MAKAMKNLESIAALAVALHAHHGCLAVCRNIPEGEHDATVAFWYDATEILDTLYEAGWTLQTYPSPGESAGYSGEVRAGGTPTSGGWAGCYPPTTHRYVGVRVDGRTTGRIRCYRCGYEKDG